MRFSTRTDLGILGVADSAELWTGILSNIPDEVLLRPNVKILNVACGQCTEAIILAKRMIALGKSKQQANDSLWLVDKFGIFTNLAKKNYGFENAITADFLEWETDMKFDVVVGNPPYQDDSKGKNKRWPLWMRFVDKSKKLVKDGGWMAMVTPSSWMSPNDAFASITEYDLKHVNLDTKKYFAGVNSSFSSVIVHKVPTSKTTTFESEDSKLEVDWHNLDMFPNVVTATTISLMTKFFGRADVFDASSVSDYHHTKPIFGHKSDEYCFEVFHTNAQRLFSNVDSAVRTTKKVLVTLSGNQIPFYTNTIAPSEVVMVFPVKSKAEGTKLVHVLNSKLYKCMAGLTKYSGFALKKVWKQLPKLDLTRPWTDAEIYEHFGLTQEEIDYVEANTK